MNTTANGGPFDCYPPGWRFETPHDPPHYPPYTASPSRVTTGDHHVVTIYPGLPSIQEQMGIDPVSKLAAAIERLAEALEVRERH